MEKDKNEAAGAASINTLEFQNLAADFILCVQRESVAAGNSVWKRIVSYADAHAAQHFEAGYRKGCAATLVGPVVQGWQARADQSDASLERAEKAEAELEEWRFTNRIDELQRRCARAEASLARLVEDAQAAASAWNNEREGELGAAMERIECFLLQCRAILPAKAEKTSPALDIPQLQEQAHAWEAVWAALLAVDPAAGSRHPKGVDCALSAIERLATPAPAMGEELPPVPAHPSEERYRHFWSAAEEDAIRAYGRACMALRQPGAVGDAYQRDHEKAVRAIEVAAEFTPALKECMPITPMGAINHLAYLLAHATPAAPVSQPAAQEYRSSFLDLAENCGARITGKPDGSEAIEIVFSIEAWRRFDVATATQPHPDCRWPSCLPAAEQDKLADEVTASLAGEAPAPLSAPAGSVRRGRYPEIETRIGQVSNAYGGVYVSSLEGKFCWSVENYNGHGWEEIPETLFNELLAFEALRRNS